MHAALAEEFLPCRIFKGVCTSLSACVQARIRPDVADFVRLTCLGLPEADDLGIFLTSRERRGERIDPLLDAPPVFAR